MQETKRHTAVSQRSRENIEKGASGNRNRLRSKGAHRKMCSTIETPNNDFLNTRIRSIPQLHEEIGFMDIAEQESRDYFFDCAEKYLSLLGYAFDTPKTESYFLDINKAVGELTQKIPRGININLEVREKGGRLHVFLYKYHRAFDQHLAFLPISVIDFMPEEIAQLFKMFLAFYSNTQGINYPIESQDFDWAMSEYALEMVEENPTEWKGFIEMADNYLEGHFGQIVSELKAMGPTKEEVIQVCEALLKNANKKDNELIAVLITGVNLLSTDSIMRYDYLPERTDYIISDDYYDEIPPLDVERTFCIVWEESDPVVEFVIENINMELRETSCWGLVQFLELDPNMKEVFVDTFYPERFENWYFKLYKILEDYGKTN